MPSIYPVASTRVSELLLQKRLLSQFQFDKSELVRLQDQLSTGYRISVPSQDAPAALRAAAIQRLIEQKEQAKVNLATSESFVAATENALSGVSELLINVRANALAAVGTTNSQEQRDVLALEARRAAEQLVNVGNRQFRGRYLFAGSTTSVTPFELEGSYVIYRGNENKLQSYVDVEFLSNTNVTGDEVFGAFSPQVRGRADLQPILTLSTRLSDLRGGVGVDKGSFIISDSVSTKTIDISSAETVEDVVEFIEANPPDARTISVRLSQHGLIVDIDDAGGGNLTIREVAGGTTAAQLGIVNSRGSGVAPIEGTDLNPTLLLTTRLADLLGVRARGVLQSVFQNNDLIIEAVENGADLNGVQVRFTNNMAAGDQALVSYDETARRIDIDISPNATTANTVVAALNDSGLVAASLDDKWDDPNNGLGTVELTATTTLNGGAGIVFDKNSGIQILNKGETYNISFEDAETVEQLLNILNSSDVDVLATINAKGTGIDVRSRVSGSDFAIGENGGSTASELGIRTFTRDTLLSDLNYGRGVDVTDGTDFVIQRRDGVELDIDLSTAISIGDLLDLINNDTLNVGDAVVARLAEYGNGIEIYDENAAGAADLKITRGLSTAARDLGLVAAPGNEATAAAPTIASASLAFSPPNQNNTAVQLTAPQGGFGFNDIEIELQDTLTGDVANVTFDPANQQLLVEIDSTQTTANTVLAALAAEGTFTGALDTSFDTTNDGTGILGTTGVVGVTSGGAPHRLRARDVNPMETKGVFNSLIRLNDAIQDFDLGQVERSVAMLDDDFQRLNFARSDLGVRAGTLDAIKRRMENEDVELKAALSNEIDADFVQAISDLSARQANMEATLRMIGKSMQLTVLDFL
ncbi:MAG: hypothetical protein ACC628_09085 [Pirellulaceae bacterium]